MQAAEITERFIVLETKVAYQDKLLHELSDLLREKGQELDRLLARVLRLESAATGDSDGAHLPHERPPHY